MSSLLRCLHLSPFQLQANDMATVFMLRASQVEARVLFGSVEWTLAEKLL